jgi:hypothetical protein
MPTRRIDTTVFSMFVSDHNLEHLHANADLVCHDQTFSKDIVLDFSAGATALTCKIIPIVSISVSCLLVKWLGLGKILSDFLAISSEFTRKRANLRNGKEWDIRHFY